jgi:hypothetical protein
LVDGVKQFQVNIGFLKKGIQNIHFHDPYIEYILTCMPDQILINVLVMDFQLVFPDGVYLTTFHRYIPFSPIPSSLSSLTVIVTKKHKHVDDDGERFK